MRSAAAWTLLKLAEQSQPGFHFSAEQGNDAIARGVTDSLVGSGPRELHEMFLRLAIYLPPAMAPVLRGKIGAHTVRNNAEPRREGSVILKIATIFADASEMVQLLTCRDRQVLSDLRTSFELGCANSVADTVVNIVALGNAPERAILAELLVDHLGRDPYSTQRPTQEKLLEAVQRLLVRGAPEFATAIRRLTYLATMERFGVHRQMISVISAWSEDAGKAARRARIWPGLIKRALFAVRVCLQQDSHRSWNRGDLDNIN